MKSFQTEVSLKVVSLWNCIVKEFHYLTSFTLISLHRAEGINIPRATSIELKIVKLICPLLHIAYIRFAFNSYSPLSAGSHLSPHPSPVDCCSPEKMPEKKCCNKKQICKRNGSEARYKRYNIFFRIIHRNNFRNFLSGYFLKCCFSSCSVSEMGRRKTSISARHIQRTNK